MRDYYNLGSTYWVYGLLARARAFAAEYRDNIPLLTRLTAHLGIIALVIFGLLLSGVEISVADSSADAGQDASTALPPPDLNQGQDSGDLRLAIIPLTINADGGTGIHLTAGAAGPPSVARGAAPVSPDQVVQYTVQEGDTVTGIAAKFHISADSVLWANAKLEDDVDMLTIGQVLNIPPTTGVLYTVQKSDTIQGIAAVFKAKPDDILNDPFNQSHHDLKANPPVLKAGQLLMVPKGEKASQTKRVAYSTQAPTGAARGTGNFAWPVAACMTQLFWARHSGIDLAAPKGTPIYAADSGIVAIAGWDSTGYGNMILLNHGNGYLTRYGHLSAFNVRAGQSVKKGALIGRVGSTGHSTGPHLHFEVIFQGAARDPRYFVKGRAPGWCAGYH